MNLGAFRTPSEEEGEGYMSVIIHATQNQEIRWEIKHRSFYCPKLKEMVP